MLKIDLLLTPALNNKVVTQKSSKNLFQTCKQALVFHQSGNLYHITVSLNNNKTSMQMASTSITFGLVWFDDI